MRVGRAKRAKRGRMLPRRPRRRRGSGRTGTAYTEVDDDGLDQDGEEALTASSAASSLTRSARLACQTRIAWEDAARKSPRRRGLEAHGFALHRSGRRCREQAREESPPTPSPARSLTQCASSSCQSRTTWEERRRTRPPCALHSYASNAAHSPNRQRPNPRGWASTIAGMLPRYPASHRRVAASCTGRGFSSGRRRRSSCSAAS